MKNLLNESIAENEVGDAALIAAYCMENADAIIEKVVESVKYKVDRHQDYSEDGSPIFSGDCAKISKDAIRESMGIPGNWVIRNKWDCFEYDGRYTMCQVFVCTVPDAMTMFIGRLMMEEIFAVPLLGVVHRYNNNVISVTVVSGFE